MALCPKLETTHFAINSRRPGVRLTDGEKNGCDWRHISVTNTSCNFSKSATRWSKQLILSPNSRISERVRHGDATSGKPESRGSRRTEAFGSKLTRAYAASRRKAGSPPNCDIHAAISQCLRCVDPRHSIARDQRPLRVRPKSARAIPNRLMRPLSAMAMSMLLPVPDDDHCVACPTCETLVAQRFSSDRCGVNKKRLAGVD